MKKKFLSNLILLLVLNILIKPFWFFGIEVGVQNQVGDEMYGFYFSLFNFAFILNIILDLGITNFNNRKISRDNELLSPYLSRIVPLKLLLSIFYGVFVLGSGIIIGYDLVQFKLLAVLIANQFLSSFILYLRSNISGLQLFRTDSLLSVLDRSLMILFNGILLWSSLIKQDYKIEWFVYSQTVSYFITSLIIIIIIARKAGRLKLKFDFIEFKTILKQSYPFAILILLMSFFNRADSVMLERLLEDGKEQAGIYAQSFRILDAISQFAVLFAGLLLPMFSRMIKLGEKVDSLIQLASSILLSTALSVLAIGVFYNDEIIQLLYKEVRGNSDLIFSILMCGFLFISISYIYGTLLTANKSLKQLNTLAAITLVINIVLNLLLIPYYKAVGAAIASIVSQAFYAIGQVVAAHLILKIHFRKIYFLRLGIFLLILLTASWLSHYILNWVPGLIVLIATALVSSVLLKVIRPKEFMHILQEEG